MKLYFKNMVSNNCKTIIKSGLEKVDAKYVTIELGEVTLRKKISSKQHFKLKNELQKSGFELIDDHKNELIQKLKTAIVNLVHNSDEDSKTSLSNYISLSVNDNFISLNTLFAEMEGITIEKYIIKHKIELVKKFLVYDNLNLAEIALKMHYTNTAQLSNQFRDVTGITPSHFMQLRQNKNINIESEKIITAEKQLV